MTQAHVFQHKYTGVQIFVFHVENQLKANQKFAAIVVDDRDWLYLGLKQVLN